MCVCVMWESTEAWEGGPRPIQTRKPRLGSLPKAPLERTNRAAAINYVSGPSKTTHKSTNIQNKQANKHRAEFEFQTANRLFPSSLMNAVWGPKEAGKDSKLFGRAKHVWHNDGMLCVCRFLVATSKRNLRARSLHTRSLLSQRGGRGTNRTSTKMIFGGVKGKSGILKTKPKHSSQSHGSLQPGIQHSVS